MSVSQKNSIRRIFITVVAALAFGCSQSSAQDIEAGIDEVLNQVITLPLPQVLGPIITVAQELDTLALSAANGLLVRKIEEIQHEEIDAGNDRTRLLIARKRMRAARRMQRIFSQQKAQKAADERKEKEDGWDPFFAVLTTTDPIRIPGSLHFELLNDSEEGNRPFSALIQPVWGGSGGEVADVTLVEADVDLLATSDPRKLDVNLSSLRLGIASFFLTEGLATGPNIVTPFWEHNNGVGSLDPISGAFELRFEAQMTNDLYSDNLPILTFINAIGVLHSAFMEVTVSADDPMLVPVPQDRAVINKPSWGGAVMISFDAQSNTLTWVDPVTRSGPPHISLARYNDGSYSVRKSDDQAIGATLNFDPVVLSGNSGSRSLNFANSRLQIRKGTNVLLEGELQDIAIDGITGEFFGTLTVTNADLNGSRLIREMNASQTPIQLQFSTGVGAYDLVELTNEFSVSANVAVDLSHGTAGVLPPIPSPNSPILALFFAIALIIVVVLFRRQRNP
jgi:hypothetical protein